MTLQPALAEFAALHCTPGAARLPAGEIAAALAALPG